MSPKHDSEDDEVRPLVKIATSGGVGLHLPSEGGTWRRRKDASFGFGRGTRRQGGRGRGGGAESRREGSGDYRQCRQARNWRRSADPNYRGRSHRTTDDQRSWKDAAPAASGPELCRQRTPASHGRWKTQVQGRRDRGSAGKESTMKSQAPAKKNHRDHTKPSRRSRHRSPEDDTIGDTSLPRGRAGLGQPGRSPPPKPLTNTQPAAARETLRHRA